MPITRSRGAAPRVVLSMGPGKLSGLRRGDRLELSSEIQVDGRLRQAVAALRRAAVRLRPARGGRARARPAQVAAGAPRGDRAPQARAVASGCRTASTTAPWSSTATMRVGDDFPCRLDRCYANVVVSASSPQARGDERMIIGANKPSGRIVQNKSRLNAIRIAPRGRPRQRAADRASCAARSLRLRPQRKVVLSQKVDGARARRRARRHRGDALGRAPARLQRAGRRRADRRPRPRRAQPTRLVRRSRLAGGA